MVELLGSGFRARSLAGLAPNTFRGHTLSPMAAYLPVYCESCAHASLSSAAAEAPQICSFCEGSARVVPGPIYGDGDWLAFAEIDGAVFDSAIDGVQASALAAELQELLNQQLEPEAIVLQMIQRVPSLAPIRPALINALPRGLRMLMTLLLARSRDLPLTSATHRGPAPGCT